MKFSYRDWKDYPRRFPFYLQVSATNFLKAKNYWIRRWISHAGFSFLFRGRGEFYQAPRERGSQPRWIEAPCLIVKAAGQFQEYGPVKPEDAWDELYIKYDSRFLRPLIEARLLDPERSIVPMSNPGTVWTLAEELAARVNASPPEDHVDAVDRLCERLILEAMTPAPDDNPARAMIERVLAQVRKSPQQPFDIQETARLCGMSEETFRRRWSEVAPESPRRYIETLRLQEACRALVESDRTVKSIAHSLGFEDELYFSRRFQSRRGISPREYREQHRA